MSVIDLMTAKMNLLRIMTNTSPHFHLNFLMFDVAMKSNEQAEILLPSENIFKQKVGLHWHAAAALYQTPENTTGKREVTFRFSVNHKYCHLLFTDGCLTAALTCSTDQQRVSYETTSSTEDQGISSHIITGV